MMTGHPGIFAGGDLVPSARSVTVGIGHGKTAAGHIDRWLRRAAGRADVNGPESDARQPVAFGAMNAWYYSDAPHVMRPRLDAARRTADFAEVVGGLDADTALYEARRCMSCGNCFGCDNCLRRMPRQRRTPHRGCPRLRLRLRLLQGMRTLCRGVPMRSHRHGARTNVSARVRNRSPVPYPACRSALTGPRRPEQPEVIGRITAYDARPRVVTDHNVRSTA